MTRRALTVALGDVPKLLDYAPPEEVSAPVGSLVEVPLGARRVRGVVVGETESDAKLKPVAGVVEGIRLDERSLSLARWMSAHYLTPLGRVLRLFLPPGLSRSEVLEARFTAWDESLDGRERETLAFLRARNRWMRVTTLVSRLGYDAKEILDALRARGLAETRKRFAGRKGSASDLTAYAAGTPQRLPRRPTREQAAALESISSLPPGSTALVHGVTGSGKTALYIWLARRVVERGKSAIVLVPEIALTPQLARLFLLAFPDTLSVFHSAMTVPQRFSVYFAVARGKSRVVLGTRSAAFLPVADLGLVVVDEEADDSFKSETEPAYNARDIAVVRAKREGALAVLGSATPSAETYLNARAGRYSLAVLTQRVRGYSWADARVVDMREAGDNLMSIPLVDALSSTIHSGGQAILLLNRRGWSPVVICNDCGYVPRCDNCSIALTFHKSQERGLLCHMCGAVKAVPSVCPGCGGRRLRDLGYGTQRVETLLNDLFPGTTVLRMDSDTTAKAGAHRHIFQEFSERRAQVLIGTRMVTKGFDFPGVRLVAILRPDALMSMPDCRAEERTFSLLTQTLGRVRMGGKAFIQTYNPEARCVKFALAHDYVSFMAGELRERFETGFPPYRRMVSLLVSGFDEGEVSSAAKLVGARARELLPPDVELLGPSPCPILKVRNRFRWRVLALGPLGRVFWRGLSALKGERDAHARSSERFGNVRITIDIDPRDLM